MIIFKVDKREALCLFTSNQLHNNGTVWTSISQRLAPSSHPRLYFLLPKADGRVVLPTAIQREVIQCSTINFKVDFHSPWQK